MTSIVLGVTAINPEGLRKAMDRSNVTVSQLARRLGVTTSYMDRIVKGDRRLKRNPELRNRIARELDVPIFWIEQPTSTGGGEAA